MNCCTKVVLFLITTKKYNGFFPFLSQIRQIGSIHEGVHYLQSATCFLFGRPFTGKTWLLYPLFTPIKKKLPICRLVKITPKTPYLSANRI
jgi:hypothetical protein